MRLGCCGRSMRRAATTLSRLIAFRSLACRADELDLLSYRREMVKFSLSLFLFSSLRSFLIYYHLQYPILMIMHTYARGPLKISITQVQWWKLRVRIRNAAILFSLSLNSPRGGGGHCWGQLRLFISTNSNACVGTRRAVYSIVVYMRTREANIYDNISCDNDLLTATSPKKWKIYTYVTAVRKSIVAPLYIYKLKIKIQFHKKEKKYSIYFFTLLQIPPLSPRAVRQLVCV